MPFSKSLLLLAAIVPFLISPCKGEEGRSGIAYIRSADENLPGYYFKPEGKGPFPAIVLVRAASRPTTESNPTYPEVVKNFTARGYVVVIPCWHVPADVAAEAARDPLKKSGRMTLPEFQAMARDIGAAVTWTKSQSFVDEDRVAIMGHATGGILTMLLAEQQIGVRAFVAFSPAAAMWNVREDIQKSLLNAVREAKAPIFLIQAQNDLCLGPSESLGAELARKGDLSLCKVYPPFGATREQGNNFAIGGSSAWGEDVFKFLQHAMN
jgi:dienelactone hydrolase